MTNLSPLPQKTTHDETVPTGTVLTEQHYLDLMLLEAAKNERTLLQKKSPLANFLGEYALVIAIAVSVTITTLAFVKPGFLLNTEPFMNIQIQTTLPQAEPAPAPAPLRN